MVVVRNQADLTNNEFKYQTKLKLQVHIPLHVLRQGLTRVLNNIHCKKMAKKRGKEKKTTGQHSWVKGSKLEFFEACEEEFFDACDDGTVAVGKFYHKMSRLFILRWGWDLPFDEDGPVLLEALDNSAADALDLSDSDEDEQEERQKRIKVLQLISLCSHS